MNRLPVALALAALLAAVGPSAATPLTATLPGVVEAPSSDPAPVPRPDSRRLMLTSPPAETGRLTPQTAITDISGPIFGELERLRQNSTASSSMSDNIPAIAPPAGAADPSSSAPGQTAAERREGALRLRDFLRLLTTSSGINGPPGPGSAGASVDPRHTPFGPLAIQPGGSSGSLIDAVLNTTLDSDLRDLLGKIIAPSIEPGGFVSFSIAGLGRFVLLFSEDDRSLRMVDLDGQFSVMISQPRATSGGIGATGFDSEMRPSLIEPSASGRTTMSLQELLEFIRGQVVAFLLNPLTIGCLALSILLWGIWRIRRRPV